MGRCATDPRLIPLAANRRARLSRSGQAGFLALAVLLSSCTAPPVQPTATELAERLQATAEQSSALFLDSFTTERQPAAQTWYLLWRNAEVAQLAAGDDQRLRFSHQLPGDQRTARTELAYQLTDDRISLLSPVDGFTPIWLLPEIEVTTSQSATLLSAGLVPEDRAAWLRRIHQAVEAVAAFDLTADGLSGLVVEVPPAGSFTKVSGESATTASAVTRCEGGAPRIVVNPAALTLSGEWLNSTLVHEAVHVATDSACQPDALPWVVEGMAEAAAAATDPATAKRNRRLVAKWLATEPLPVSLPTKLESLTDYALAQVAVEQVGEHAGSSAPALLQLAITDPDSLTAEQLEQAEQWYLTELKRRRA